MWIDDYELQNSIPRKKTRISASTAQRGCFRQIAVLENLVQLLDEVSVIILAEAVAQFTEGLP
jgi:hypothetical protein